jgi:leucyl/phenylalanyl-tRNA--protein transferase
MWRVPEEPSPTHWRLPLPDTADDDGLCAVGADLEPGTLLSAYRLGLFPMPIRKRMIGWWSPDPRGVLPLDGLVVHRSLRRSTHRYEVRVDTAFRSVMEQCADPHRPNGWITPTFVNAYERLYRLGWAHSVETYLDGVLVGGLYGLHLGNAFFGESMFSRETDASKVALVHLVARLIAGGYELLDTQFVTEHLNRFGAVEIPRRLYRGRLARALQRTARFPGAGGEPVAGGAPVDEGALVGALLHSSTQTS